VLVVAAFVGLAANATAQTTTTTKESKTFEVIGVDGNHLVARLPEGTREVTVPEDFRFTVDGKEMSVHELKPGMKGTATITTNTTVTPVTVTEVRNGTVMRTAGPSIIVRTDSGIRMFGPGDVAKRDVTLYRNGQPASISDFRTGDRLTATIVTEKPPKVVSEREVNAMLARDASPGAAAPTSAAPAPSAAPSPASPAAPGTAGAAPATAPKKLPKTASPLPAVGLTGLAFLAAAVALTVRRRRLMR
jgi:hypothetical protein